MIGRESTCPDRFRLGRSGTSLGWPGLCFLLLLALGACARAPQERARPPIETSDDLTAALRGAGAEVQTSSAPNGPDLGVPARQMSVGGAEILVYEYTTLEDRQTISTSIMANPTILGGRALKGPTTPRVWVSGRLIIVYPGQDGGTILLLSGLVGDPLNPGGSEVDEPYPPAVAAAIEALGLKLGVDPAEVWVSSFDGVEWPDACLGLPAEDEQCAEVVTPGFKIELLAGQASFEAHTNLLGTQVRFK